MPQALFVKMSYLPLMFGNIQKIYLQVNFLVFHKLYLFYPSSLDMVNENKPVLSDGCECTVFFFQNGTNGIRGNYLRAIYL